GQGFDAKGSDARFDVGPDLDAREVLRVDGKAPARSRTSGPETHSLPKSWRERAVPSDLRRVLEALLDGVVVVDDEGAVRHLNAEACRILGTSTESLWGKPVERIPGADALASAVRSVLAEGVALVENEVAVARRFAADLVVDV